MASPSRTVPPLLREALSSKDVAGWEFGERVFRWDGQCEGGTCRAWTRHGARRIGKRMFAHCCRECWAAAGRKEG